MPLRKGKSRAAVSANISTLLGEGWPRAQGIAIAMRKAGRPKPKKRPAKRST